MKTILSKLSLSVLAASVLAVPSLHAQTQNILFGRTNVSFDSSFVATFQSVNATVTLLDGTPLSGNSANFSAVTGTLNTNSLAGEVFMSGGYRISIGNNVVRLQNFVVDTTNTSAPVLTAMLVVNDNIIGRLPVFSEVGSNFNFVYAAASAQLTGINLFLTSAFATQLNNLAGEQVFTSGQLVGTDTQNLFFAATPTGSN